MATIHQVGIADLNSQSSQTKLLTVSDVAQLLAVTPLTIRRLQLSGKLPAVHIGRAVRFYPADIQTYLSSHKSGGHL